MSGELGASNFARLAARCAAEIMYSYPSSKGDEIRLLGEMQDEFYKSVIGSTKYQDYENLEDDKERATFWIVMIVASTVPALSGIKAGISTPNWIINKLNDELSCIGSKYRFSSSGYSKFKFSKEDDQYTKFVNLALIHFFRESADMAGIYGDGVPEKWLNDLLAYLIFNTRLADIFDFNKDRAEFVSEVAKKANGTYAIEFLPLIKDYAATFRDSYQRLNVIFDLCEAIESSSGKSNAIFEIIFFKFENKIVIDGTIIEIKLNRKAGLYSIAKSGKEGCAYAKFHENAFRKKDDDTKNQSPNSPSKMRSKFFQDLDKENLNSFGYSWKDFIDEGECTYFIKSHIKVSLA